MYSYSAVKKINLFGNMENQSSCIISDQDDFIYDQEDFILVEPYSLKSVLSGYELSEKWPWKVSVSRLNGQGQICKKKIWNIYLQTSFVCLLFIYLQSIPKETHI